MVQKLIFPHGFNVGGNPIAQGYTSSGQNLLLLTMGIFGIFYEKVLYQYANDAFQKISNDSLQRVTLETTNSGVSSEGVRIRL